MTMATGHLGDGLSPSGGAQGLLYLGGILAREEASEGKTTSASQRPTPIS